MESEKEQLESKLFAAFRDLERWKRAWPHEYSARAALEKKVRDLQKQLTILTGGDLKLLELKNKVSQYEEYVAEKARHNNTEESVMFAKMIDVNHLRGLEKAKRELKEYIQSQEA